MKELTVCMKNKDFLYLASKNVTFTASTADKLSWRKSVEWQLHHFAMLNTF